MKKFLNLFLRYFVLGGMLTVFALFGLALFKSNLFSEVTHAQSAIVIDGSKQYQTIDGFGAAIFADPVASVGGSKSAVAQAAVNELGLTIGRLGFDARESIEQCHCVLDGNGSCTNQCVAEPYMHTWKFFKQNDNNDPYNADVGKFHEWVDWTLDIESMEEYKKLGMTRYLLSMFEPAEWLQTTSEPTSPCVAPVTNDGGGKHCLYESAEAGEHVSAFIQDLESRGYKVPWFSVMNEPEIDNNGSYDPNTIQPAIDLFADRFACRGIPAGKSCKPVSTIVVGPENVSGWEAGWIPMINKSKPRITYAAFHQYEGGWDISSLESSVVDNLRSVGNLSIPKMQTEFSNYYGAGGNPDIQDTYEEGFITGWQIHMGLTEANYSIWMWWTLAHAEQNTNPGAPYYYENGPGQRLIYAKSDGSLLKTPKYWAMRMFSRFARPGMVRHGVTGVPSALRVSAYSKGGDASVVVINTSSNSQPLPPITLQGITPSVGMFRYRFSEADMNEKSAARLAVSGGVINDTVQLPPYSITTYSTIDTSVAPTPPSPTPTPTPFPSSTKFKIGDRVRVTSKLNVRSTPSLSGTLITTKTVGTTGTIVGGPTSADGFNWYQVRYDN